MGCVRHAQISTCPQTLKAIVFLEHQARKVLGVLGLCSTVPMLLIWAMAICV
jgi:hypothetical protein